MRVGLVVMVASLSAFTLSANVSAAPLQLICEYKQRGVNSSLVFSIANTSSNSSGSVEYESGKTIDGQVTVSSKHYKFSGKDEDLSVSVSVSRNDGSATISSSLNGYTFYMTDPKCSKYEGALF